MCFGRTCPPARSRVCTPLQNKTKFPFEVGRVLVHLSGINCTFEYETVKSLLKWYGQFQHSRQLFRPIWNQRAEAVNFMHVGPLLPPKLTGFAPISGWLRQKWAEQCPSRDGASDALLGYFVFLSPFKGFKMSQKHEAIQVFRVVPEQQFKLTFWQSLYL